jgi:monofunctional glycosyltransferase
MEKSRFNKILFLILKIIWKTFKGIVLTYAVLFSAAGTIAIVIAFNYCMTPLREVNKLKKINPKETAYMIQYRKELVASHLSDTLHHTFIPIDSISPYLKSAVLAAEDDGFYTHPGFDIEAIVSAYEYNKIRGKVKRGASTITQQLAKNLFLDDSRNFERKIKELAYTVLMERYLGKERILELYLNYAQWGKNIFGCEAAAKQYYKKSSLLLTRTESARMAAVLAMPTRVSPTNTQSSFIAKRIAVIANNLYLHGTIDDSGFLNLTGILPAGKETDSTTMSDSTSPAPFESVDITNKPVHR